jgi:sugar O-acyltransferase (sialic acid O-acetyltransferase NeuD family)
LKKLIIVGAGGFGREILSWVKDVPANGYEWQVAGFLDDHPGSINKDNYNDPIIGSINDYRPQADELFVMGNAAPPRNKIAISQSLQNKGAIFTSLIHPTVSIGDDVSIGDGCVVCRNVILTCNIIVGKFVSINLSSTIGHDVTIGDGCTLHPVVNISGFVKLGKGVQIGSHGCILPGAVVEDFATVGAGSVVLKYVKSGCTVMGVPAKMILRDSG